ncbi:hypothetical protein GRZ55_17380 [Chelativorans sp. ZYF759]|uniref:hypothetical protein n=1 Tax=Chelativorans sp. ZYF759 TaxID=2692213 RepID=UPI00145F3D88|nr:hypothetical protein [Chelativorans sp. ZYF759]NMG41023.1 hypothetical protein [Chelativorans sp. ZYF759]
MPRSKHLAKIRDVLTSLLLVLAVSLAWPSMAAPHDRHAESGNHHPASADAHGAPHHHRNVDQTPVCSAELGCCAMTHCHPGVAQALLRMSLADLHPKHEPSSPAQEAGVDPPILVPPPRALLV